MITWIQHEDGTTSPYSEDLYHERVDGMTDDALAECLNPRQLEQANEDFIDGYDFDDMLATLDGAMTDAEKIKMVDDLRKRYRGFRGEYARRLADNHRLMLPE